jgi:hypothetical protein
MGRWIKDLLEVATSPLFASSTGYSKPMMTDPLR